MKTSDRYYVLRTVILAVLLSGVAIVDFRLSYTAQVDLAVSAGIPAGLAAGYPIGVDVVILITTLIAIWNKPKTWYERGYVWAALGVWTATSVLGNAYHVVALPAAQVKLPIDVAIAVNAVPALSLFVAIHLATTMAFQRRPEPAAATKPARATRPTLPSPRSEDAGQLAARRFNDTNQVTDEDLLNLSNNQRLSVRAIAEQTGMSKTSVADRLNRIRTLEQEQPTA